jgi:ornithine cyclodeaminase/alanine dehydrogenase-like protein (mu-crystallin family)
MTRFITNADVATHLTYEALIPAMEKALAAFSAGKTIQPVRNMLTLEEGKRYFGIMPAATSEGMGAKLVAFYPGNENTTIPTHTAIIALFDPATGVPLAVLDGRLITEMRTAAVSAAVTKYATARDRAVLTLLGSGVQAQSHLEALRHVCQFREVRVWSRNPEKARAFAVEHGITAMPLEQAVRGADVIVTVTSSMEPVLKGTWLKEGSHVNAIGACRPNWRELDDDVMANTVIVDSRDAALRESGDVILSKAKIFAEAGEIFGGTKPLPKGQTTVFKSLGLATEDIATARLVYDAMGA